MWFSANVNASGFSEGRLCLDFIRHSDPKNMPFLCVHTQLSREHTTQLIDSLLRAWADFDLAQDREREQAEKHESEMSEAERLGERGTL
jgi:hypothetical protein